MIKYQPKLKLLAASILTETAQMLAQLAYWILASLISIFSLGIIMSPSLKLLKHLHVSKTISLAQISFIGTFFMLGTIVLGTYLLYSIFKDLADLVFE